MEIVKQIKQICIETDNEWVLNHSFTKLALCDLQLKETLEKEKNIRIFETERNYEIDKLNLIKHCGNIYSYETKCYTKSKWIIPNKIEGKIPGFILLKCTGDDVNGSLFTHGLEFACVRPEYRKQGILKNMINQIPEEWNIWLEASSKEIENVENIWEKCGFHYHETINNYHLIYKKLSSNL